MADDDDYDKTRRMSLTQAYRRPNDIRQPTMNRRIGINNGNHPVYKVCRFQFEYLLLHVPFRMMITINNNLVHPAIVFQPLMPLQSTVAIHSWRKSTTRN